MITTVRVLKGTRDNLDTVHKELRSRDSSFTSKDKVIDELIKLYYYYKNNKPEEIQDEFEQGI